MAVNQGDRSQPSVDSDHAEEFSERARYAGGKAAGMRLRHLKIIAVIAVQCGLAAAVSWEVAARVVGVPRPVFAPSAAVGTIVAALGQRARRTVELLLGVVLGLLISDLLLPVIGFGPWQTGLVVTVAIGIALLMMGRSGALVAHAGSTAVLICTLSPAVPGLPWHRSEEAAVGGVVGLVVVGLLLPISPLRVLDRAAAPVIDTLCAQLDNVARALVDRDPDLAIRALGQLRGSKPDLARLHEALSGAEEVVTLAPVHWKRRRDVDRYRRAVDNIDFVVLECRGVARVAARCLQRGEPVPEPLPTAVARLAEAIRLLRHEGRGGRQLTCARQVACEAARLAGRAATGDLQEHGEGIVTILWTVATDLLRATGDDPDTANRLVREAAKGMMPGDAPGPPKG